MYSFISAIKVRFFWVLTTGWAAAAAAEKLEIKAKDIDTIAS